MRGMCYCKSNWNCNFNGIKFQSDVMKQNITWMCNKFTFALEECLYVCCCFCCWVGRRGWRRYWVRFQDILGYKWVLANRKLQHSKCERCKYLKRKTQQTLDGTSTSDVKISYLFNDARNVMEIARMLQIFRAIRTHQRLPLHLIYIAKHSQQWMLMRETRS